MSGENLFLQGVWSHPEGCTGMGNDRPVCADLRNWALPLKCLFKCSPWQHNKQHFSVPVSECLWEMSYACAILSQIPVWRERSHCAHILRPSMCIFSHSIKLFPSTIVNACYAPFLGYLVLSLFIAVYLICWLLPAFKSLQALCKVQIINSLWDMVVKRERKALQHGSGNIFCYVFILRI